MLKLNLVTENQHNLDVHYLTRLFTFVNVSKLYLCVCIEVMSPRVVVEVAVENGE